jgi:hypothetical protein
MLENKMGVTRIDYTVTRQKSQVTLTLIAPLQPSPYAIKLRFPLQDSRWVSLLLGKSHGQ